MSLATNILELIPLAVEAVRLAVRLGSLVFSVGGDIEGDLDFAPWALSVDKDIVSSDSLSSILQEWVGIPGY